MPEIKNSREAAALLRTIADFLDSKAQFPLDYYHPEILSFYTKEHFLEAAKAFGPATKKYGEGEYAQFYLTSTEAPVQLVIARDKVCRKSVVYDCESLFSQEEISNL